MAEPSRRPTQADDAVSIAPPLPAKRGKRRRRGRGWIVLALLAVIGIGGGLAWYRLGADVPADAVVTEAVARGNIENSVTAAGLLSPIKDVDVGAQVSGQLKSLKFDVGDQVKEGDLVAEIDSASIETRIEIDEAELANLNAQMIDKQAQVVLSKASLARQRNLVASNSAAKSALDQAVAALATAQANVASLDAQIRKQQATLKDTRISLSYTKIYAPLTGTIVNIAAKEGQTLNANQSAPTIVTIADLSTMTVEAEVSEADIGRLNIGMEAYFTLLGQPAKRYSGTLRQIKPTPSTENNVVLYYALFDVPNPEARLMMNMTAQVFFIQSGAKDVLTIPVAALKGAGDGASADVTVVTANGGRETRKIATGVRNRVRVEVKAGLSEGERVVVLSGSTDASRSGNRGRNRGMPGGPPMF